jgi:cytochrome c oxidase cbb3-type subunit 3
MKRSGEVRVRNDELKSGVVCAARSIAGAALFFVLLIAALSLAACEREQRNVRTAPPAARVDTISQSDIQPGQAYPRPLTVNPSEYKAFDVSQGKQLYSQYNCAGCHFHGGGGIGPPLMDAKWIYGGDPQNVFQTIVEGRPNGMPSFRGKIPDAQVWQLVAYVRSMSGQIPRDVSSGRSDSMNSQSEPEQLVEPAPVKKYGGQPPSTVQSK